MGLRIKERPFTIPFQRITTLAEGYLPFPSQDEVLYNEKQLLAVGLLTLPKSLAGDKVLLAIPISDATFYGDAPYLRYSLTDTGWQVDEEDQEELSDGLEDYDGFFERAEAFYREHGRVTCMLETDRDSDDLLKLGGQPPLGWNWDDPFWEDDSKLFFAARREGEGENYEKWSSREIVYYDEELDEEFIYLGYFSYDTYIDGGGESIIFYQPKLKKVIAFAEFS